MTSSEDFDRDQVRSLREDDNLIPEIDLDEDEPGETYLEETVDSGQRRARRDVAEMGLGAEPHDADELADAALGHELRGRRAVTRDDEGHGSELLDREENA